MKVSTLICALFASQALALAIPKEVSSRQPDVEAATKDASKTVSDLAWFPNNWWRKE